MLPHISGLRRAALRLARGRADADDLVQEAVLRAWRFWPQYQQGSNCRAWLHRILTNTFINGYRRKRREREILGEVRRVTELQQPVVSEPAVVRCSLSDEVRRELDSLRDEYRQVLWLVDVEGCSYRDTAARLGCPLGTVMSRLHRARRALHQGLSSHAPDLGYSAAVTARVA